MAGPVVTALLSPNPASGTWAPADNITATVLASAAAAGGTFVLRLDLGAGGGIADGDIVEITVSSSADGANERVLDVLTVWGGGPAPGSGDPKMWLSPPYPTADRIKFAALLAAGGTTSRNFPWSVLNLNGV